MTNEQLRDLQAKAKIEEGKYASGDTRAIYQLNQILAEIAIRLKLGM